MTSPAPSFNISMVPLPALNVVWDDVKKLLSKSIKTSNGKYEVDDIYTGIRNGEYQLWTVTEKTKPVAAFTTRILNYPRCRAIALDWMGGTGMKKWSDDSIAEIRKFAVANNCDHIEGYGRKAWGRLFAHASPEYTAYRMELTDAQG